jgi:hypothetical protein
MRARWIQSPDNTIERLFSLHEELYNGGARNFLLIDLPPINRSPACKFGF